MDDRRKLIHQDKKGTAPSEIAAVMKRQTDRSGGLSSFSILKGAVGICVIQW